MDHKRERAMANKIDKSRSDRLVLYMTGAFIVGCVVGRASSSVSLPQLPSSKVAHATYENAVDAIKALLSRVS
jgi:hypothetical protein